MSINREKLEFIFQDKTYSFRNNGIKRTPTKVSPAISFGSNMQLTDREIELYLSEFKSLAAFINKKGLIEEYKEFQEKNYHIAGDNIADWFKKWN